MKLGVLFLLSLPLLGQETRAQLLGRGTDPSGSVIAGAAVRATNTATAVVTETVSNTSGDFLAPFLVPGPYRLSVSMPGFKEYVLSDIQLRVSDRATINVTLEVGQITESVQVASRAPLLETAAAAMG